MRLRALAFIVVLGCDGSSDSTPSAGGVDAGAGGDAAMPKDGTNLPSGPTSLVRLGNFLMPSHLWLDLCLATAPTATFSSAPLFRGTHDSATFGRVTTYRRVKPGSYVARFVISDSADCEDRVEGIPDLPVQVPMVADRRFTLALVGDLTRASKAISLKVLEDDVTVPDGKVGLRVVHLSPRTGPVDLGAYGSYGSHGESPDAETYAPLVESIAHLATSPGDPHGYFFVSQQPNKFFTTFGLRVHGETRDFFGSQRSSDPAINSGVWTFFVRDDDTLAVNATMCRDGGSADAPRVCYPCGFPTCEGR